MSETPPTSGSSWFEDRTRYSRVLDILRTKEVPRHKHAFWYAFGGLALFFFCVQLVTGILLTLYYSPSPATAHESVQTIMLRVPFGWMIRSIHSWSSNLLVATILIHFFSVYFLKAYRKPREMMWLTGVALLFLVLGFAFTGYLLPWDTKAYFATQIGTEIPRSIPLIGEFAVTLLRGGEYIAEESMKRLFALHVVILPLLSLGFTTIHLILNQVQGSSVPIGITPRRPAIPFFPNYVYRDLICWSLGFFALMGLVMVFPVELGPKADPFASAPVGIRPEWYFLPLFQTIRFMPPLVLGMNSEMIVNFLVMVFVAAIFLIPFLDRRSSAGERSPAFTVLGIAGGVYMMLTISLAYLT